MDRSLPVLKTSMSHTSGSSEPVPLGSTAKIQQLQKQLERLTLAEQKLQVPLSRSYQCDLS